MTKEDVKVDKREEKKEKDKFISGRILFPDNPPLIVPPFPFPQRFKNAKLYGQFAKFVNMFKKLEVNIPFMDALAQMPNYFKFMKEIMSNKKKLDVYGYVSLSENCSAMIQRKLLEKLRDPSSVTIPCAIGEHTFKTLCDLRASINLMPLSVMMKLNLGELTPTTLSFQMVDQSMTYAQGIIEDVLVKADKFIFPVNFVVLEMEEDMEVPIILGRMFLATDQALIDVKNEELTLRGGDEEVKFNLTKDARFADDEKGTCIRVDGLIPSIDNVLHDMIERDPLEKCLTKSLSLKDSECEHPFAIQEIS